MCRLCRRSEVLSTGNAMCQPEPSREPSEVHIPQRGLEPGRPLSRVGHHRSAQRRGEQTPGTGNADDSPRPDRARAARLSLPAPVTDRESPSHESAAAACFQVSIVVAGKELRLLLRSAVCWGRRAEGNPADLMGPSLAAGVPTHESRFLGRGLSFLSP